MSSPGCPYDKPAMETFFGTVKSECLYRVRYATRSEAEEPIAQYVHFCNFERINFKNGLTPYEIKSKAA
ncbi:MAG: IS3 family transposase [Christensenellales bacterium]